MFDFDSFSRDAFSDLAWLFGDEPSSGGGSLDGGGGTFQDLMTAAGVRPKRNDKATMDLCILAVGGRLVI